MRRSEPGRLDRGALLGYSDPHVPSFPRMREHRFDLKSTPLNAETLLNPYIEMCPRKRVNSKNNASPPASPVNRRNVILLYPGAVVS